MGSACSDNMYDQIKEKHPGEFQKYIEMSELRKQIEMRSQMVHQSVNSASQNIKARDFGIIDSKEKEIQDHFSNVKHDVDKAYPGGTRFLESGKQASMDDILGMQGVRDNFSKLKQHLNEQFTKEQHKVNEEIVAIRDQELNKSKAETPNLSLFQQLTPKGKDNIYASGLREYKTQIQTKFKDRLPAFDERMGNQDFVKRFQGLMPMDRLNSLTQISKEQLSKNAVGLVGQPGEGRVALY